MICPGSLELLEPICLDIILKINQIKCKTFFGIVGKDAEFTCTILDQQEYPVSWMRLGDVQVSISKGSELLITDKRFSLKHDKAASSYTLKVKNVRKSDATTYQCQVMVSMDNIITRTVDVKVVESPVIKEAAMTKTKKVVEGSPVQMTCEATGFPIPKISWSRTDGSLMPNGKPTLESTSLSFEKVKKEDRGSYQCSANNGIGNGQNTTLSLEVEFGPHVRAMRPRIAQALFYEAHLTCEVVAFPPPSIIWKRGDEEVITNDNISIDHFAKENEIIVTTLKVR